jgi:hypothetical protein
MKGLNNPIGMKSLEPSQSPFIMNPFRFGGGGAVGGWVELGRTTLGATNSDITVSSLADKRYYMYLFDGKRTSVTVDGWLRMGNGSVDTGANYARRLSTNGGADTTAVSDSGIDDFNVAGTDIESLSVGYIANLSGKEKLMTGHKVMKGTAGAGTAPNRLELVGKWANTSNPLDTINFSASSNTWASGFRSSRTRLGSSRYSY